MRLQVASAFFPQIIGKGGQIKVQSLILAIIPWIFRVRLQLASVFFPQIIGKGGQTRYSSIDSGHHTMDTQGEAAGGLSFLPSDHWQRRSDQGTAPLIVAITPWIFRVRLQWPQLSSLRSLAKEVRSRYSSIDCSHYTMDIQCEAAGGLTFLPSDHWQRRSDQGTAPLIVAITPWIFRVSQLVASAFFPQIIGKGGQIKVQLH